ncbi:MAG: hypothetical protein LBF40_05065 [Deltaproteobacteria bacterium]|jgi:hypothetical protein|nr:hypothetical protein [Deltaproteobacteria bacterium]
MGSIADTTAAALPAKAPASRAAWREEMLGQLLSSMRERWKIPENTEETLPAERSRPLYGKGHYVDVYV